MHRPVDVAGALAGWQAAIVADPSQRVGGPLQAVLEQVLAVLRRGRPRLAPAVREALVAAAYASLAGPRDFDGDGYNEKLDRCSRRAAVDRAVCEVIERSGVTAAVLAPELAAILGGSRVAPCVPQCCNASWVVYEQRHARSAAVRTLTILGPAGLARLTNDALQPCFAPGERTLARAAAALLARHVAAAPQLTPLVLLACRSAAAERDPCVRFDLCLALARAAPGLRPHDAAAARRWLAQQTRDEREQVRATAVRALAAFGASDRVEAALQDRSSAVKYAALRALGRSTRALARRHPAPSH